MSSVMCCRTRAYPDCTSLESTRDTESGVEIGGVNSRRESVGGAVPHPDCILFSLEFGNRANRTKSLLLQDLHIFADVGENSRLDEIALLAQPLSARLDLRAFIHASFDISFGTISRGATRLEDTRLTP
jgi:hypothetical protein